MITKEKIQKFFEVFNSLEISWQLYSLAFAYLIITLIAIVLKWQIGMLLLLLLAAIVIFGLFNFNNFFKDFSMVANRLSNLAKIAEEDSLYKSPIAVIIYDTNQRINWINPALHQVFDAKDILGKSIMSLDEEFVEALKLDSSQEWVTIRLEKSFYKLMHQPNRRAIYLLDTTEENKIREDKQFDQVVFGYLFLDDYDELIHSMDDNQAAKFDSELLNDLNNWTNQHHIYLKRLDEEKFLLLFNKLILDELENEKFKTFEAIREKNHLKNIPISISLGIAYSQIERYQLNDLAEQAQLNLDLALGRGGDQIVVRSQDGKARFYGGKTNPTEKRTNIRSKLVFQALVNSIEQAEKVIISGHKYPDMDSIGSAIGLYRIVKHLGKECRIIVNEEEFNHDIVQLLEMPQIKNEKHLMFVNEQTALEIRTDNTLIVLVDHHKPSLSEAEALIDGHDTVIIDHHRRSEEFPKQTVLTYIEPYASSTSELVTEFFMYTGSNLEALNKFEATAMLAGIIVDTNNFSLRTGSRTFDAASYLKSRGADTAQINRMLKEDLETVKRRNHLIEKSVYLSEGYVVSCGEEEIVYDTITAAQSADEMLGLKDVEASFVIYKRSDEKVGISARSLGTINVQIIMEKLGGGGHLSNAAVQLKDKTIEEAYELLLSKLDIDTGRNLNESHTT